MLATLIQAHTGLSPEEAAELLHLWTKPVLLKRGDFLVHRGEVGKWLYFVQEGALRIFYETGQEEICVGFAYESTLICSFPSFILDKPSDYYIQALRQSDLLGIHKSDFFAFMEQTPAFERFWRKEIERALIGRIDREIDLMLPTPEERLARLKARSPGLFQKIPQKYIASYLRMKPETLSRLRNS